MNLIGDHTDHAGGLVLPMALEWGTTVELAPGGDQVELTSAEEPAPALVPLDVADPADVNPPWARYVAGVLAVLRPEAGGRGTVRTTLPIGGGLSSSAALEVAVALALGFGGTAVELARACQRAEQLAAGVPCGVMDPLISAAGVADHALLIDCSALTLTPVLLPDGVDVVVAHSGQGRSLAGSAYAHRRAECEAAARLVGPLATASLADVARLPDPLLRRRARHVVSECARVRRFVDCLVTSDLARAGTIMTASHASLRDDFEVSTPALDRLVERMGTTPGVHGARLTGAGFGGCVVALAEPGSPVAGWRLRAGSGARVEAV